MWFNNLNKPLFNPPSSVFTPVWIVLYCLMALSLIFFIITKSEYNKTKGYVFFSLQLFLNLIWSPVFFLMQNIGFALFIIVLLDIFVILTVKEFFKVSKISSFLLFPYLLWILFATYLNGAYFYLN